MSGPGAGGPPGRLLFVAANPSVDRTYELDRLNVGEIHRPRSIVAVAGGKGLNAARAAATLGGSVTTVAIVGGRAGDWIGERLAQLGIDARLAHASGETRTCVSILDRSSGALTEIYERGDEIGPTAWERLEAIVRAELERGDVALVALSGSLPPGAPQEGYGRIARIARIAAAGSGPVAVLADTYGPALGAVLAEHPAIVKLNAAEAGEASGVPVSDVASAAAAARVLGDMGAASVIVTVGLAGAVVLSDGDRTHLVPPDERGVYSVGSGDAFFGGLAVAFGRGESVVEAARLGLAAGIANAQVPGAGELDPRAIDAILQRITSTSV
jgi:1-phosphofructokinase family hexose kinase